jgi:YHS domain-containing protein
VLYRVGDYVGNTVNVAARAAAHANANEILVTSSVAERVDDDEVKLVTAGRYELAGVETPVELWRVDRRSVLSPERDPVCGMAVGDDAVARLRYDDVTYAFCSPACLRRFLEEPERYTASTDRADKPDL